ncbi:MAG: aspartate carbamoyltransferase catalytic subunit [Candidatus Magasanikbacteria bacterium GW2011_GWC2_41_17]|uniref:Aspartate carbamoyltransferase n=1 Tax=Candidatus Magasanikbacteria bacterium GW2011_GWC2_41_17 TaxID=1619048 RepID=A0A0G0VE25_9BACT|nr:MAG: aspartate carbamoyltransferase catalytic subunit [Candidatus Magasanikbacteria bacterium GW2011_GWC2_41_17]
MPSSLINRDLISINDLTKNEILFILQLAKDLKAKPQPTLLQNKVLASLFFEPSTRTRLSFETAMERLGGRVIGFADKDVTSASKGETLYDSIRIIGQYADVIAMRHPLEGSARRAAEATDKPILNGGDGANQHPTQTLLDLFTIQETQKKLTGLSIALAGDLKYGRTVHSLMQALLHFSPHYLEELKKNKIKFSLHEKMEEVIKQADIFYLTRIQKERFADSMDYERVKNVFRLTLAHLIGVKKNLKILHPLPRVNELDDKIDTTSHAYYFQQAENGLYVRQALLGAVLGKI